MLACPAFRAGSTRQGPRRARQATDRAARRPAHAPAPSRSADRAVDLPRSSSRPCWIHRGMPTRPARPPAGRRQSPRRENAVVALTGGDPDQDGSRCASQSRRNLRRRDAWPRNAHLKVGIRVVIPHPRLGWTDTHHLSPAMFATVPVPTDAAEELTSTPDRVGRRDVGGVGRRARHPLLLAAQDRQHLRPVMGPVATRRSRPPRHHRRGHAMIDS